MFYIRGCSIWGCTDLATPFIKGHPSDLFAAITVHFGDWFAEAWQCAERIKQILRNTRTFNHKCNTKSGYFNISIYGSTLLSLLDVLSGKYDGHGNAERCHVPP